MNSTIGSHNVFLDLGFEPAEAENLLIRSDLMIKVRSYIRQNGWDFDTAAAFFGETPHGIRLLMEGDIDHFSIDKLIGMVVKTGQRIKIQTVPLALAA